MPITPLGLRERKKVRTRAALQRHALQLFTEKGYRDTTIEQIAEAAEVSPSTFFRYFATKEDTVLADYFDARVIGFFREAPARMSPVQAMKYAMQQMTESMSPEELELELKRNQLIATVPELQRGMVEEMLRPMRLLAAALADRLGTAPDDPFCTAYAGALIGGLVAISGHDGSEGVQDLGRIVRGADILDQVLRTPPRRTSARKSTSGGTGDTGRGLKPVARDARIGQRGEVTRGREDLRNNATAATATHATMAPTAMISHGVRCAGVALPAPATVVGCGWLGAAASAALPRPGTPSDVSSGRNVAGARYQPPVVFVPSTDWPAAVNVTRPARRQRIDILLHRVRLRIGARHAVGELVLRAERSGRRLTRQGHRAVRTRPKHRNEQATVVAQLPQSLAAAGLAVATHHDRRRDAGPGDSCLVSALRHGRARHHQHGQTGHRRHHPHAPNHGPSPHRPRTNVVALNTPPRPRRFRHRIARATASAAVSGRTPSSRYVMLPSVQINVPFVRRADAGVLAAVGPDVDERGRLVEPHAVVSVDIDALSDAAGHVLVPQRRRDSRRTRRSVPDRTAARIAVRPPDRRRR